MTIFTSSLRYRLQRSLRELADWLPLALVALLVANDHFLKSTFHNAVTGKLSDLAICFLLPLLTSAALGIAADWTVARRLSIGGALTAVVFTALEMSDAAGAAFTRAFAVTLGVRPIAFTRDATDLGALACIPLAIAYGRWNARRPLRDRRWARAWGAITLAAGSLALMADSIPGGCGERTAPVVFRAQGDCGAGGLIVVEPGTYSTNLQISNAEALLPPAPPGTNDSIAWRYDGTACPLTLERGEWQVTVNSCPQNAVPIPIADAGAEATGDAGADASAPLGDAGAPPAVRCPPTYRACKAALEGDALWFTCVGADPSVTICRSQLTVMP